MNFKQALDYQILYIDDLIKPNADPCDREEGRASFVKLLMENSQIGMKHAQCIICQTLLYDCIL